MTTAGAAQRDNKDVQYMKAQVDTTVEEITVRNGLCVVKPWNWSKFFAKFMTLNRPSKFISTWTGSQMSGLMPP